MDILLLIFAIIISIIGVLGCLLPILPGPPLSFVALLLIHFSKYAEYSYTFLLVMALITIAVTILDYIIPLWGTKHFGGTKSGVWGAGIGMVVGMIFLGPFGIIIGPFIGAIVGELIHNKDSTKAFRAGLGAFLGFLAGVGLKLVASLMMTYYIFKSMFSALF